MCPQQTALSLHNVSTADIIVTPQCVHSRQHCHSTIWPQQTALSLHNVSTADIIVTPQCVHSRQHCHSTIMFSILCRNTTCCLVGKLLHLVTGEGLEHTEWVLFRDVLRTHGGRDWGHLQSERSSGHLRLPRWNCASLRPQQVIVTLSYTHSILTCQGLLWLITSVPALL